MTVVGCEHNVTTMAENGRINWTTDERDFKNTQRCWLHLSVAPELFLVADIYLHGEKQLCKVDDPSLFDVIFVFEQYPPQRSLSRFYCLYVPVFQIFFPVGNQLHFLLKMQAEVTVSFSVHDQFLKNRLPVVTLSDRAGYITSPGYDGLHYMPDNIDATYTLMVPQGFDVVMTSFVHFKFITQVCLRSYLTMFVTAKDGSVSQQQQQTKLCRQKISAEVFEAKSLTLSLQVHAGAIFSLGFKMLFSFHEMNAVPEKFENGLFNCSVKYYPTFQQHLHCNMYEECVDGQDEGAHCSFSSEDCQGKLFSQTGRCYFTVYNDSRANNDKIIMTHNRESTFNDKLDEIAWLSAKCAEKGGHIAVIQTKKQLDDVLRLLSFGKIGDRCTDNVSGDVIGDNSVPAMYRKLWIGREKYVLYNFPLPKSLRDVSDAFAKLYRQKECRLLQPSHAIKYSSLECTLADNDVCGAVCEIKINETKASLPPRTKRPPELATRIGHEGSKEKSKHNANDKVVDTPHSQQDRNIQLVRNPHTDTAVVLVECPRGHVTHLFLLCDIQTDCGTSGFVDRCGFPRSVHFSLNSPGSKEGDGGEWNQSYAIDPAHDHPFSMDQTQSKQLTHGDVWLSVRMFVCDSGVQTTHYSQVCDFRPDCEDSSDESFCVHDPCKDFTCSNGQCVAFNSQCDDVFDCLDMSDETSCEDDGFIPVRSESDISTPALINLDGSGYFTHTLLDSIDQCPDTHYSCTGEVQYCLPLYTRCNGFYHCIDEEDESGCENTTCPGLYRCRGSGVCLHPHHLCDVWPQCPQENDERLCEEQPCPSSCLCHGMAFLCHRPFPAHLFPNLRYVDGTGSRMALDHFYSNHYLVHLILSDCALKYFNVGLMPNQRHLDLSNNLAVNISMDSLLVLENLQVLSLSGNPVRFLFGGAMNQRQRTLRMLDLSRTDVYTFSAKTVSNFVSLQILNLSQSALHTIDDGGFQHVPALTELDLTGCPIDKFPQDIFQGLEKLQRISAGSYKLCCKSILPVNLDENFCFAPEDEISSCDDLLRSETYRGFLWLMSALAITGNAFSLVFRSVVHNKKGGKNTFNTFVTSLCLADLVMGVYVTIIGSADVVFQGKYLHHSTSWTHSLACQVAGFLSFVSNEVSALTIVLITLDRFIVLRFPFSRLRFGRMSALTACALAWSIGFVLAMVPLLPAALHWQFYSQTGICIPLPITRHDFKGRGYSFGVMIIFNFALFLLIAGGQAVIYWSVRHNSMVTTSRKSKDSKVARRLITVAVTNFLCWFPIGVCGLLASAGKPIPGEVNVAMAIFVLPLNSAFNPFLYTLNIVMEKRQRASEERLLKMLQARLTLDMEN